ncbi:heme ABC exporter ATP-binding protein CcmA [Arenibaculum sp.]|uniref:heme ABC exporter ATP-binding protein CcmA n=1 Tax=Arenibaculum sp. TaxID=2865862 RepID=UPI002E124318|nr:heme ABC exporter ATP-binding protein CcmA [Arenibaculum sp.]
MPDFSGTDLTCLRGDRLVFRGLDFQVASGGALLLTGPNGSGKSSLLRLMAGLLRPFSGQLAWNGEAIADEPDRHRARVHYVGHQDAVKPVLSALENLAFWAGLGGAPNPAAAAHGALASMGAAHVEAVPGRYLSAGQKRRLNLARLIAVRRPLWLLDEPTVALDRDGIHRLEAEMARHRSDGGIVVASTHAEIDLPCAVVLALDRFPAEGWDTDDAEDGDAW